MRKSIPKAVRQKLIARYGGRCGYCGVVSDKLQLDHMKPVQSGGTDDESNLMPACFSCNNYKNVFDVEGFRRELEAQVYRARRQSLNFRLAEKFGQITTHPGPVVFWFEKAQTAIDAQVR